MSPEHQVSIHFGKYHLEPSQRSNSISVLQHSTNRLPGLNGSSSKHQTELRSRLRKRHKNITLKYVVKRSLKNYICLLCVFGTTFCIWMQPRGVLMTLPLNVCFIENNVWQRFDASRFTISFCYNVSISKAFIQNFNSVLVFFLMENKHSLITFIFSTFRR